MIGEGLARNPLVLALLLALAAAEYAWRVFVARKGYDWRAALASIGVMLGGAATKPIGAVVTGGALAAAATLAPWQFKDGDWWVWLLCFVALEFAYYWFHRASHMVRWLWTTHAVHHSAAEFTLPAAVRLGWTGPLSLGWLFFVPLVLVGFPPLMVGVLLGVNLLYQYLLHTEAVGRLGPLEYILNTPSHHRAHHSSERAFLDCNFGGVLIVFDRLFGTFRREPDGGGLRYGLTEPLDSRNPVVIALHEWVHLARDLRASPLHQWPRIALGRPRCRNRAPEISRDKRTLPACQLNLSVTPGGHAPRLNRNRLHRVSYRPARRPPPTMPASPERARAGRYDHPAQWRNPPCRD